MRKVAPADMPANVATHPDLAPVLTIDQAPVVTSGVTFSFLSLTHIYHTHALCFGTLSLLPFVIFPLPLFWYAHTHTHTFFLALLNPEFAESNPSLDFFLKKNNFFLKQLFFVNGSSNIILF